MLTVAMIFVAMADGLVQRHLPRGVHPEWGPEPPVAPYTHDPLPDSSEILEMTFPVIAKVRMDDDYNFDRGTNRHTGIDIRGPKMSAVVAPFRGVLGIKRESFWIYGDNGWTMLGTHMNDDNPGTHDHSGSMDVMFAPNLEPGQVVEEGQFIGYLGESGDATAPHLHFEIYQPGDASSMERICNPFPSLLKAKVLKQPVPVVPSPEARPAHGQVRFEGCLRKVDPAAGTVTVLLVAKELEGGQIIPVTHVRYLRLKLSPEAATQAGGWDGLQKTPGTKSMAFYVPASVPPDDAVAVKATSSSIATR